MRIGLAATAATVDRVIDQAQRAEGDGFCGLWFTSAALGDPHIAMALAAKATSRIEVGTAILQTYPCHPVLQASQAIAVASAIGSPGRFTLGLGPSHRPVIEGMLGLSYETPGRHTEEYVRIVTALLRGERVDFVGEEYRVHAGPVQSAGEIEVPVLVSALGPRLLRAAGQYASGTIPWMATAKAIECHVSPRVREAAAEAGRPAPRIAAGLPVAVHDDVAEARETAMKQFAVYGSLPNYQRILDIGGVTGPAEAAIVGSEAAVIGQIEGLFSAGATEVWLAPFPVGNDRSASRARTRTLLNQLAAV
jgi:F420-dependent oxidoreductase-like protein